jgi:GT2 family glycosyltransferase
MIGIIVLNYNSAFDTIKCIDSIEKYTSTSYKIYIVDGFSHDNSYECLNELFKGNKNIEILKSNKNGGYSYGNNLGVLRAIDEGAEKILIINPDVFLKNNAIDLMEQALINQPDLAVVGPRIFNKKNEDVQFASKLYTLKGFLCSKKPLAYFKSKLITEKRYYQFNPNIDFCFQGMVSGCCFMINTKDFKSIDFFDSNIFLYYEEDIIAYKLAQINKLTKIISDSIVIHNHSNTVKKEGAAFIRFHRFYSSQYVLKKYLGINKAQFIFVSLFHVLPFSINAIFSKSYRKLYIQFLSKLTSLYKVS